VTSFRAYAGRTTKESVAEILRKRTHMSINVLAPALGAQEIVPLDAPVGLSPIYFLLQGPTTDTTYGVIELKRPDSK